MTQNKGEGRILLEHAVICFVVARLHSFSIVLCIVNSREVQLKRACHTEEEAEAEAQASMLMAEASAFGALKQKGCLKLSRAVLAKFRADSAAYFRRTHLQTFATFATLCGTSPCLQWLCSHLRSFLSVVVMLQNRLICISSARKELHLTPVAAKILKRSCAAFTGWFCSRSG